jgi:hypothetical protein
MIRQVLIGNYERALAAREKWMKELREAQDRVAFASGKVAEYTGALNVIVATLDAVGDTEAVLDVSAEIEATEAENGNQSGEHKPVSVA